MARDAAMERCWDDVGYSLMERQEGPFGVLHGSAKQSAIEV